MTSINASSKFSRSEIWTKAWAFIKNDVYTTLSEALKQSWKYFRLRAALLAGKVEFSFKKADGTIRKAIGTLNSSLFSYVAKGQSRPTPINICKYWDLEKDAYRSFKISNLV